MNLEELNKELQKRIKEQNEQLQEQQKRLDYLEDKDKELKTILDTIMESVMILEDGKIIDLNPQAIKTFGLKDLEEGLGMRPLDFVPKYDHQTIIDGMKNPDTPPYQADVLKRDGTIYPALIHGKNIILNNKTLRVTSFLDVSELKRTEIELEKAKIKAEESNKIKSEFLANMSHEIRTPMHGIIGMSHLALQTDLNDKQFNYLQRINSSASSLLGIINDILDFSKVEAKQLHIEKMDFDMFETINSILDLLEFSAQEKNISLKVNYNSTYKDFIGDSLRISQIFTNLLGNAIKFTEMGDIEIFISRVKENRYRFKIKDSGIGLSNEHKLKLFDSFSQADSSTTRKYGGTGLGLTICKQLVTLMNGEIWVESELGVGSEFIFEIELQEIKSSQIFKYERAKLLREKTEDLKESLMPLQSSNVLLVEDNETNQEIVLGLLEGSNINVDIAVNGQEAIAKFLINDYDLILMDLQMPIMGGIQASKKIRETDTQIPIIALTANAMKEDTFKSKEAGMNEHLSKPIDIKELYSVLLRYISNKEREIVPLFNNLDSQVGLKHMSGNKKLYLQVLYNFYETYKELDLESLNDEEFNLCVHTIKGLSLSIGASALHKSTLNLEEKKNSENLKEFNKELMMLTWELSSIEKPVVKSNKQKIRNQQQRDELFSTLKKAVLRKRPKECNVAIDALKSYELSIKDQKLFEELELLIKAYSFKEAASKL